MAGNRAQEAASSYNNVRTTWEDPVLTPTAISRMIGILSKSTVAKEKEEAESLKKELAEHFPKFQQPK